jgi:hypothetical protein
MQRTKEREYRSLVTPLTTVDTTKRIDSTHYVEGYATTFSPYVLFEMGGNKYYENIMPDALDGADMSNVIMQYDHRGKVFARQSNGTLLIEPDDKGLFVCADLSKSAAAKELHEEIVAGLITKMSWAFTVSEESYNKDTRTWTIRKIKKVYDVSAVSIPANEDTDITARNFERRNEIIKQQELLGLKARALQLKIKLEA